MKNSCVALCVLTLFAGLVCAAQTQPTSTSPAPRKSGKKSTAKAEPSVTSQLEAMRRSIEAQQSQIQQLSQQVQTRDSRIQQLEQRLDQSQAAAAQAQAKADNAAAEAAAQEQNVTALKSDVTDLKSNATNAAMTLQDTQKAIGAMENPMALHYKGITLTPGGFLAAETVWRQHALGSDINTPFNSIPYNGSSQSNLSEFFGSGRQSRVSMLAEGKISNATLRGYYEADFLSAGVTSNNNESNSYSLRQRQAFAQAALESGWTFTGGQMWSLVTETKKGLDNRTEALPMTIDPQYNVGFSWARQYGFRVTKKFGDNFWLGASLENSQATTGGTGLSCTTGTGTTAVTYACNNYLIGSQGASSGLYNPTANYSYNYLPDFVFKAAFEPGWGHFEVFGIVSDFQDRIFPDAIPATPTTKPSAANAYNNTSVGSGLGANGRGSLLNKHLDVGLHFLGGRGIGRYGTAGLPDLVVRPDGVLDPIKSYQGLATVEVHAQKFDVYFNFGGEYAGRTTFDEGKTGLGYGSTLFNDSGCATETLPAVTTVTVLTPTGTANVPVLGATGTPISAGFDPGSLSKCSGQTKNIFESTAGFWYRFYKGPKGTLQAGPQYSRITRNGWSGQGIDPQANENMFLTSFRYYLP